MAAPRARAILLYRYTMSTNKLLCEICKDMVEVALRNTAAHYGPLVASTASGLVVGGTVGHHTKAKNGAVKGAVVGGLVALGTHLLARAVTKPAQQLVCGHVCQ